nr:ribonuclease H-like domain-containing protein [Tanacetum cinerariifolium]
MESLNPQVVAAAKLPILNPNEFDLWKMRIEQYFLMIDYSLWEVILNGDIPLTTRIVNGSIQITAPTTSKQGLAKADLEEQSLDDLFNNLKIYEAEVKGSSTSSQNTQNIAFVSLNNTNSTNESITVVPSVFVASSKAIVSTLPNVDSLSDVMIYSFFASEGYHVVPPPYTGTFMPPKSNFIFNDSPTASKSIANVGNPQQALKDKGVIYSGCSRHMTRNIYFLLEFKEINRGYVAFGGNPKGGKILVDDVVDITFDVKENENDVHVSPSGSDKTDNKKHDDKAKRHDKGKSHVDSPVGVGFET